MKKLLIYLTIISATLISCKKDFPISFTKKTKQSSIQIVFEENKTFRYTANSTIGAAFNETGTYFVTDSTIILKYKHKSFTYGCNEIPLPNDTLLVGNYNDRIFLYPIILQNITTKEVYTNHKIMQNLVMEYSRNDFHKLIGIKYFECSNGSIDKIFKGTQKISSYYDKFLPEENQ